MLNFWVLSHQDDMVSLLILKDFKNDIEKDFLFSDIHVKDLMYCKVEPNEDAYTQDNGVIEHLHALFLKFFQYVQVFQ